MENKFKIIVIVYFIMVALVASALLGYYLGKYPVQNVYSNLKDNTNCSGLDLITSAKCLNKEVNNFFKYNLSNNGKNLSVEELKSEGGTCLEWSKYFIDNAINLGFHGEQVSFWNKNKTEGHAIALVYNNNLTEYCILDQTNLIGCGRLGSINETR
jgi:hypothetical protein